ncbi:MAG: TrmB family transcriptional regulator [Candidatus Thorarchaeota archaeon]
MISDLMQLGLKKNEARAYYTLVTNGRATASRVASLAHIPRSKVYEALYGLEAKGMIRKVVGSSPAEFQPYSPRDTIPFLLERVDGIGKSIMKRLSALEQQKTMDGHDAVRTVVGEQQIIMELRTTIVRAKKNVRITARDPSILRSLIPAFIQARQHDVEMELYVTTIMRKHIGELNHYLTIKKLVPSSEALRKSVQEVLVEPAIVDGITGPEETAVFIIDGTESVAVFNYGSTDTKPWALCVRNTLIATIQWQVIKTVLSTMESIPQEHSERKEKKRLMRIFGR